MQACCEEVEGGVKLVGSASSSSGEDRVPAMDTYTYAYAYACRVPAVLLGHVVKIDEHGHVAVAVAQVLLEVARLAVVKVRLVPAHENGVAAFCCVGLQPRPDQGVGGGALLARHVLHELQRLDVAVGVA